MSSRKGINVNVGGDTRQFVGAVDKGTAALEGMEQTLLDVANQSDKTGSELETSMGDAQRAVKDLANEGDNLGTDIADGADKAEKAVKDLGKTADTAGEKLEDSFEDGEKSAKDLAKQIDTAGESIEDSMKEAQSATEAFQKALKDGSAATKFGQNTKAGATKAKGQMDEVKQEAKANAAETFSSFDGSAQSFVSGIQGTFGGLVASLNPIWAGVAAGAGIAIGLLTSALTKNKEAIQKNKEKVGELADQMIDAAGVGVLAFGDVGDKIREMATETEEGAKSLKDIKKQADDTNMSFGQLTAAFAGSPEALKLTEDQLKANIRAYNETHVLFEGQEADYNDAAYQAHVRNVDLLKEVQDTKKNYEDAAAAEKAWLEAGGAELQLKTDLIEGLNDAYDDAATSVDDFIDSETGVFDVGAYIKAFKARERALADYQTNLLKSNLPPETIAFLNSMGTEAAAAWLQGYVDSGPSTKKEMNRIARESVSDTSGIISGAMENVVNKKYKGPTVTPDVDQAYYNKFITKTGKDKPKVEVKATANSSVVDSYLYNLKNKQPAKGPEVTFGVNTAWLDRTIDKYKNKTVYVDVVFRTRDGRKFQ